MKNLFSKIKILYEDADTLIVDKPAGLVVHSDGKTKEPVLTDWLLKKYPKLKNVGEPLTLQNGTVIDRPGIVHRLDRETSGVLLIAKNQKAFLHYKKQFKDRLVTKKYHAFLSGELRVDKGVIDRPIGRSKSDFRQWSAQRGARGEMRDAVTAYKVLARGNGYTYVEVEPKTGRTHQIRVHFKAINFPVVADSLYAPKKNQDLGFKRLALHARSLNVKPVKGKVITVEADLPKDFKDAVKKLA